MTRHTPPAPALADATTGQLQDLHRHASTNGWGEVLHDVREELQRRADTR